MQRGVHAKRSFTPAGRQQPCRHSDQQLREYVRHEVVRARALPRLQGHRASVATCASSAPASSALSKEGQVRHMMLFAELEQAVTFECHKSLLVSTTDHARMGSVQRDTDVQVVGAPHGKLPNALALGSGAHMRAAHVWLCLTHSYGAHAGATCSGSNHGPRLRHEHCRVRLCQGSGS